MTTPRQASARDLGPVLQFGEAELRLHDVAAGMRRSPWVAVLDAGEPVFGDAALGAARRDPRLVAEGYLRDLGTDAIGLRGAPHLSTADLLYRHLRAFAADTAPTAFIVSPSLPDETLGLLLGVAMRAGLRPGALVDAAVLAASLAGRPGEHVLHVEAGLQDGTLTHVLADADETDAGVAAVTRGPVHRVPGLGLRGAREMWLRHVRERSIALWRVDPLLDPARAAAVLAQWPAASTALARGDDGWVELDAGHRLEWTAADLLARMQATARGLIDAVLAQSPTDGVVLLDPGVAELPGIAALIARHRDTRVLGADAYVEALARLAPQLGLSAPPPAAAADGSGVAHLLRLPRAYSTTGWQATPRPRVDPLDQLLVLGARAHALAAGTRVALRIAGASATLLPTAESLAPDDDVLVLQVQPDHVLLDCPPALGARVEGGRTLSGPTVLRPGDRVQLRDGAQLQLVALASAGPQHPERPPHGI